MERRPGLLRPRTILAVGALLTVLALLLGVRFYQRDPLIGGLLLAVSGLRLSGALAALVVARRGITLPAGTAWRYFATGWLLLAVAGILKWGIWMLTGAMPRLPSLVELFRLAGICSILWGAAVYSATPQERFGRLRNWLDIAILVPAVLGVSWLGLARPVMEVVGETDVAAFWALAWPVVGLVLLTLYLRLALLARPGSERRSFVVLLIGALLLLAGDLTSGFGLVTANPVSALLTNGFQAVGALLVVPAAGLAARGISGPSIRPHTRSAAVEPLLPIAYTYAVVGLTAVDAWLVGTIDQFGLGMSIALTLLVFARQGVVAGQSEMRQYAALVEGAADLAFICQPDGRISFSNPAFLDALQKPDGAPGGALSEVLADLPDVSDVLERATADGWQGEVTFRRVDGTRFPARLSLRPVRLERQALPLLAASAVDLTLIKEREALLRSALDDVASARADLETLNRDLEAKVHDRTRQLQETIRDLDRLNQELLALDRLKSEFVALVSHELRAPLTNIRTGLELLADEARLPGDARDSIGLIREETGRLGAFVEAILDLSALEAGRFPLRVQALDLGRIADEAVARFQPLPPGRRIVVSEAGSMPPVVADERALASVFYHLIDNGLKYAPSGDIRLEADADSQMVRLSVRDFGAGIPPEEREKVFDMFHRLDSSDSRQVYGHGLGLHLVRRILEAMGGGIRVEEAEGGGSQFRFWLPRADTPEKTTPTGDEEPTLEERS